MRRRGFGYVTATLAMLSVQQDRAASESFVKSNALTELRDEIGALQEELRRARYSRVTVPASRRSTRRLFLLAECRSWLPLALAQCRVITEPGQSCVS